MTHLICVDPSLNNAGVAVFKDRTLVMATLVQPPFSRNLPERITTAAGLIVSPALPYLKNAHAVIEFPRTYGGRAAKGDGNDLLKLAALIGALVKELALLKVPVTLIPPQNGKQIPKHILNARTLQKLSVAEGLLVLGARHDVLDAVFFGLSTLKRA